MRVHNVYFDEKKKKINLYVIIQTIRKPVFYKNLIDKKFRILLINIFKQIYITNSPTLNASFILTKLFSLQTKYVMCHTNYSISQLFLLLY